MSKQSVTVFLGGITFDLTGEFTPAEPETRPSFASGGEPGTGPAFDTEEVTINGVDAEAVWYSLTPEVRARLEAEAAEKIEAQS